MLMDAESQYVEDLKAENARLREALEAIDDHGRALSFVETLKAKQADIEMLLLKHEKERHVFLSSLLIAAEALEKKNVLITKLCDALTRFRPHLTPPDQELVEEGREATKL